MLTIAYMTCRLDPKIEWFFESLWREAGGSFSGIKIVIVDFYANQIGRRGELEDAVWNFPGLTYQHVPPKPTVWQGPHRLTTQDYFAAANARNTALCLAGSPSTGSGQSSPAEDWIAFVDDLSVLMPGWLGAVREAMDGGYIACGAYRKVKDLVVENGEVKSFTDHPPGADPRWPHGRDDDAVACAPQWMFGCSLAAPVEAFLKINGYPEICDGMGYEDCVTGGMIARHGHAFRYDRRMLTLESEELHHVGPVMKREDPGVSPHDKSHAMLKILGQADRHDGYFGPEGLRGLRQRVLAGEPFPVPGIPEHEWFTGRPLREL